MDCEAAWERGPELLDARAVCCACDGSFCDWPVDRCGEPTPAPVPTIPTIGLPFVSSCMACHNGQQLGEPLYSGTGLSNPHPFGTAAFISCTGCHAGDASGVDQADSHVPDPPFLEAFTDRTLAGVEGLEDWEVDGVTYTALDWLQFRNPGDLRVVSAGRGCGMSGCHGEEHGTWTTESPMATNAGIYGKARFSMGSPNANGVTDFQNTAADFGFRAVSDPGFFALGGAVDGRVEELVGFPETGSRAEDAHQNVLAGDLAAGLVDGQVVAGSSLEDLITVAIGSACGDCHLGSAGANESTGSFRSSGCTACHMPSEADGTSRVGDPNVNRSEPSDSDALEAGERSHVGRHSIRSVTRDRRAFDCSVSLGIDDVTCATCHVGSNQTALQYWGLRGDHGQDVVNGLQYPANPVSHTTAALDGRFFNGPATSETYAGFSAAQLLVREDYDGDGRDDTPPDVHYEAGMACIDCHGSYDVHGGTVGGPVAGIKSQQHQVSSVRCVSCHGDLDGVADSVPCVDYDGQAAECLTDRFGNPLRNVNRVMVDGEAYVRLRGRVSGRRHWVPLVADLVDATSGRVHPETGAPLYSEKAAFAMGRVGSSGGPVQENPTLASAGFAHQDTVDCEACHTAWTNNAYGNHLDLAYDPTTTARSPTTGELMTLATVSTSVYQSPVVRSLTVEVDGKIGTGQPGRQLFFQYTDREGTRSDVFTFSDRAGFGNVAGASNPYPALAYERIAAHSTRGAPTSTNEGVLGCPACHLTTAGLDGDFNNDGRSNRDDYAVFRARYLDANDFTSLNHPLDLDDADTDTVFEVLRDVIGSNPGNQLNHPLFVAMNAGLGTGLFLFDADGCAVNPLDHNRDRIGCDGDTPSEGFHSATVAFDLDRVVERSGAENVSMAKPMADGLPSPLRDGSEAPTRSGPLGLTLIRRLTDPDVGIVLDRWQDADGDLQSP